ncbi:nucleotidyltransferase family protein [Peribacillus cavernae]|uniref:Nucleotidyltransferase family protein n=1 Tax=Peribacillus cavernae TaxID=1674310 RepID=A0A3S0VF64_9BACI|nr:nucleotidyltransferase family protein [Peribacillus cavernae]MDQ0218703.1 molybdenum cofactor cytidylyltransferase [Peribacillus cavernae]RUQ30920.1 nucleotidyltransferase family protein [Peribacillus cavernae]
MNKKVWGIILAAGYSRRMGTAKLLLPFKGKTILRHVIDHALHSALYGITVVINPDIPDLVKEASIPGIDKIVINEKASQGMSASVKSGLHTVPANADAAMFLLGDLPLLTADEMNSVIRDYYQHKTSKLIIQAKYGDQQGHPVLFDRSLFSDLLHVSGDEGGRSIIKIYKQEVYYSEIGKKITSDIDTQADYQNLLREEVC